MFKTDWVIAEKRVEFFELVITDDVYDRHFFLKKSKKLRFNVFWLWNLNKDLPTVKTFTFNRGESIKD
jgi:hypothetical protein